MSVDTVLRFSNHTDIFDHTELPSVRYGTRELAVLLILGLCLFHVTSNLKHVFIDVNAPLIGHRSFFEPRWLVGLRYMTGARAMVREGYTKFKSSMFKVRRNDKDILVISNKYIDELRNLPDSKLSAIGAQVRNLLGRYSTTPILLESDLHTRVLQTKLTPNLPSLIPILKDELDHALPKELPECKDEWVEVQIYEILCQIVARLTARVFLGEKGCESEEWLAKSIEYTENIFKTVMVLRVFPTYIRPFIAPFLPPYWKMQSDLVTAKKIISPMVRERREQEALLGAEYKKPHDLLQWMMDASDDDDGQPDKLAHRQLLLSLASIHTTTMSAAHALYDLCAYPECFEPLRDEAIRVLSEDEGWKKTTLTKMRNLDSFLKESQRINPPIFMTFNRVVRSPITLSDGTQLPVGTHLTVASDATSHDPDIIPSPDRFDPFRWARLRQSDPSSAHKHQFATTDVNSLHFGHGRHACPGRFFAAAEIKMLLAQLLLDYEFKYPQGQGRPINLSADDWLFPDPNARLLIRRRSSEGQQGAV